MNTDNKISRRDFIKTSALTGGALLTSTAIPGQAMNLLQEQKNDNKFTNDELLKGVCDIHLHCRPDSRERSVDEYGFMKNAMAAGYRAVMFKSNDFSCHDRAYIIRQALPGAECFGSFCMNRVHGDKVNPFAARKAVETSGGLCRCIWMPTLDAAYQYQSEGRKEKGIPVLDDNGQVLPEVVRGNMRRGGHHLCNRAFLAGREHYACPQGARSRRETYCRYPCQFVYLDNDTRPNQKVHRPWCIH